jgi:transcriptional regulator with XRE-family HTH domain
MKAITLTDAIIKESKDQEFLRHFQREMLINQIAKMITQVRQKAKLTQQELADKAGTTQPVVARLESGSDERIPSLELLTRLAAAANAKLKITFDSDAYRNSSTRKARK